MIEDLSYIDGCSEEQIKEAEELLDLKFPDEYVEYVKMYGCIDFLDTGWTGLNIDGELDTVETTVAERKYNDSFPNKYFILFFFLTNFGKCVNIILFMRTGFFIFVYSFSKRGNTL